MFDAIIHSAAIQHNVPEPWIRAVIETESSWNPRAFRAEPAIHDGSYGLMQLLERTAKGLGFTGPVDDLYKPEINIPLGAKLLGQLRNAWGDDFRRVYSAYNSGKPDLWETSTQVAKNVQRAVLALEKYITEAVGTVTGSSTALGAIFIMILMLYWAKRR